MRRFDAELTRGDVYTLEHSITADRTPDTVGRYSYYRRRGFSKAESMGFAIAWARNTLEEKARRQPAA